MRRATALTWLQAAAAAAAAGGQAGSSRQTDGLCVQRYEAAICSASSGRGLCDAGAAVCDTGLSSTTRALEGSGLDVGRPCRGQLQLAGDASRRQARRSRRVVDSQASHGAALESAAADGVAVSLSLSLLLCRGAEVSRKTLLRYGR